MPCSRGILYLRVGWSVRRECSLLWVESVDEQLIETKIGGNDEMVVGRSCNLMGMSGVLALKIGTMANMLDGCGRLTEFAILRHMKYGYAS